MMQNAADFYPQASRKASILESAEALLQGMNGILTDLVAIERDLSGPAPRENRIEKDSAPLSLEDKLFRANAMMQDAANLAHRIAETLGVHPPPTSPPSRLS